MDKKERPFCELAPLSTRQRIMEEIRFAVLDGRLQPGERLVEAELAASFGVSRGSVREALRGLEREGLVLSTPYRETRVATTTEEEIVEVLLPVRLTIEIFAARNLAREHDWARLRNLRQVVEKMEAAVAVADGGLLTQLDVAFHREILAGAGSQAIEAIWRGIDARIRGYLLLESRLGGLEGVAASHASLLAALDSGSVEAVDKAVARHIYEHLPEQAWRCASPTVSRGLETLLGLAQVD